MRQLVAILKLDLLMQQRYGFFYAGGFTLLVWLAVLRTLPTTVLSRAVPVVIFLDLAIIGFYFIAGMILFEKDERTIFALIVTPLRFLDYLASKLITLTTLALIISFLLIILSPSADLNLGFAIAGTLSTSIISLLLGFIAVTPFSSLSTYLIPSQIYVITLYLPMIHYFGWWQDPLFYLLPTQGSLLLLQGSYEPIELWQLIYALLSGLIWAIFLTLVARRSFDYHVVGRR